MRDWLADCLGSAAALVPYLLTMGSRQGRDLRLDGRGLLHRVDDHKADLGLVHRVGVELQF
jgi:hypothetical protein